MELYSFRDVFAALADHESSLTYLKEDTIARFLEIPDIIGASSIIFQSLSYLGAFPFGKDAPVVLGFEQMVMVIVIMTQRYQRVLKKGGRDRTRLLFRSLAVWERKGSIGEKADGEGGAGEKDQERTHVVGFKVDQAANDQDEDYEDDDLALAALESLDALEVFKHGDAPLSQASIPSDNLKKLIMLLLLVAPLTTQESLALHSTRLAGDNFEGLSRTADNILAAFVNVEKSPGVKIHQFNTVIPISLPYLFTGLNPLFEKFLFSKNVDFTKKKNTSNEDMPPAPDPVLQQPVLTQVGEILDLNVLSQLSFFLPGDSLFRRLRLLYTGSEAGFSMGSYETKVFNWRAPTIFLVSGHRISFNPTSGQERVFSESLPPKRFPDSSKTTRVVYGAYIKEPWRQTHKECFGSSDTLLFQLEPVHEVFHASTLNKDYISFSKTSSHPGITIGCPPPKPKATAGLPPHASLGAVSLLLDSSFEFGVFTHNYSSGGGAFHNSETRKNDWQDRFEVESLEVWGCGGDEEASEQRKRWEWEAREAEARRKINLGTGDREADRQLLEMAGIIGGNRSGGSMN